jgi:hypothetical protein
MPAAEQMVFLTTLFEGIEWWRLRPAPELVSGKVGNGKTRPLIPAMRSEDEDMAIVYIPGARSIDLYLDSLHAGLTSVWFNPRTGERIQDTCNKRLYKTTLNTPVSGDWILMMTN